MAYYYLYTINNKEYPMNIFVEKKDYYELKLVGKNKGVALIDLIDFENISKHHWTLNSKGYIRAYINKKDVYLHRFIIKPKRNYIVDHINHNTLDNRRANLRLASKSTNAMNSKVPSNSTTGYKGVYFREEGNYKYWLAIINIKGKRIHLLKTQNKHEAIKARILAEKKYFGEYKYNSSIADRT
jgi:hypothetical protein